MALEEICADADCDGRFCGETLCNRPICDFCRSESHAASPWGEERHGTVKPVSETVVPKQKALPESGESQIGLVIEGATDCRIEGADKPIPDPGNPTRTLPVGLSVGKYTLEHNFEFPFDVKSEDGRFLIEAEPREGIEIIPPDKSNPLIHRIKITGIAV